MNTKRDVTVDDAFLTDPRKWLAAFARAEMPWLLAHADDGVIWGRWESKGMLKLSSDVFADPNQYPAIAVKLSAQTLQQARVFGPAGELLAWRSENGFAARLIEDGSQLPLDALHDEKHLLWGPGTGEIREGFALLQEGQQGLQHAPPKSPPANGRLALIVRHYVDYDDQGQAYISLSRLVDLV